MEYQVLGYKSHCTAEGQGSLKFYHSPKRLKAKAIKIGAKLVTLGDLYV